MKSKCFSLIYLFYSLLCFNIIERCHMCDSAEVVFMFFCFHAEKLYNSTGRELRRALFSLKQIFQVTISLFYLVPGSWNSAHKILWVVPPHKIFSFHYFRHFILNCRIYWRAKNSKVQVCNVPIYVLARTPASVPACALTLGCTIVLLRQSWAVECLSSWQLCGVQVRVIHHPAAALAW